MRSLIPTLSLVLLVLSVAACEGCDADPLGRVPQPGGIQGRICDPSVEKEGIFGARVYVAVANGDQTTREIATVSSADGSFLLEGVPAGTHTVFVERGSFRTELPNVEVEEEKITELEPDECLAPTEVTMTVYRGHDRVEDVLGRLGYTDFTVVETNHRTQDRDENTPSWIVEAFSNFEDFANNDILFINCGAHEWALEEAQAEERALAIENLRRFVAEGGSIYLSDWSYDLMEELYPDAVDWLGDDEFYNDAESGVEQFFIGHVVDEQIAGVLGLERASLRYEQNRIAIPLELGAGARALIVAGIEVDSDDGNRFFADVPVLLEYQPAVLDFGASPGRIIYTTFHNGDTNTPDMDEVLRAIIYSL